MDRKYGESDTLRTTRKLFELGHTRGATTFFLSQAHLDNGRALETTCHMAMYYKTAELVRVCIARLSAMGAHGVLHFCSISPMACTYAEFHQLGYTDTCTYAEFHLLGYPARNCACRHRAHNVMVGDHTRQVMRQLIGIRKFRRTRDLSKQDRNIVKMITWAIQAERHNL